MKKTAIQELAALKKKLGITQISLTVKPGTKASAEDIAKDALVMLKAMISGDYKDITNEDL